VPEPVPEAENKMTNYIEQILSTIYGFFDNAYKEGWLLYAIIVIIVLFVLAIIS